MKIVNQVNSRKRIIFRWHFFWGWVYVLQYKKWYGWKNIEHMYPSVIEKSVERFGQSYITEWFEWWESIHMKDEYRIGLKQIIENEPK